MNWFEKLTGFSENGYGDVRDKLFVEGSRLYSRVNRKSYGIGQLELPSLKSLRNRVAKSGGYPGKTKISVAVGDVKQMHLAPVNENALFQVASQFNLLEMVAPGYTPEYGVAGYEYDPTQGPACAVAAGAATIYRNYFVPLGDQFGQTAERQIDGLADIGKTIAAATGTPVEALWDMQNGYALCTSDGLDIITSFMEALSTEQLDVLRGRLRIGVQRDVEVTLSPLEPKPMVSQAFCSALPVAYSNVPPSKWEPFALLILQAAYEATLLEAIMNARHGASDIVLLTLLGAGAFGNDEEWILSAIERAIELVWSSNLHIKIVSYGPPSEGLASLVRRFQ